MYEVPHFWEMCFLWHAAWHSGTEISKSKACSEVRITKGWMCCSREQVQSTQGETIAIQQNFSSSRQVLGRGIATWKTPFLLYFTQISTVWWIFVGFLIANW